MATYQYNILLLPRQSVVARFAKLPTDSIKLLFSENDKDKEFEFWFLDWWTDCNFNYENVLPRPETKYKEVTWTKPYEDIMSFGNENENDITFDLTQQKHIKNIQIRIDLREPDLNFIKFVIEIAKNTNSVFLDRQGFIFEPTSQDLYDSIKKSNAFSFINNPYDFLDRLSHGQIKIE
jgi:hypothetical protein